MSSIGAISSGSISALVFELEDNAETFFGVDPISAAAEVPPAPADGIGRYGRWLNRMRTRVVPRLIREANTTGGTIELILSQKVADGRNSLSYTFRESAQDIHAIVTSPSAENMERGFLAASDFRF